MFRFNILTQSLWVLESVGKLWKIIYLTLELEIVYQHPVLASMFEQLPWLAILATGSVARHTRKCRLNYWFLHEKNYLWPKNLAINLFWDKKCPVKFWGKSVKVTQVKELNGIAHFSHSNYKKKLFYRQNWNCLLYLSILFLYPVSIKDFTDSALEEY